MLGRIIELEAEIKILKKNHSDKEGSIQDRDLTIVKLNADISKLQANLILAQNQKEIFYIQIKGLRADITRMIAELESVIKAYSGEKMNCSVLASRLQLLEMELRFRLSVLGSEAETESNTYSLDTLNVGDKIEDHYKIRMEGQLQMLRGMYEQQVDASSASLESYYMDKIVYLKKELSGIPKSAENSEELQGLQVQLESCRLRAGELEGNNVDLTNKQTALEAIFSEKKRFFSDQESAKAQELLLLQQENHQIQMKYQKLMNQLNLSQVQEYNSLLIPEIARVSSHFGTATLLNNHKTVNFTNSSSAVVIKEVKKSSSTYDSSSSASDSEHD